MTNFPACFINVVVGVPISDCVASSPECLGSDRMLQTDTLTMPGLWIKNDNTIDPFPGSRSIVINSFLASGRLVSPLSVPFSNVTLKIATRLSGAYLIRDLLNQPIKSSFEIFFARTCKK